MTSILLRLLVLALVMCTCKTCFHSIPLNHVPLLIFRHYVKNSNGRLENAPYVDLSYKWAGGGLISNVLDLTKFGNMMLYSYQYSESSVNIDRGSQKSKQRRIGTGKSNSQVDENENEVASAPFLKPESVKKMWSGVKNTQCDWGGVKGGAYGLGWGVWNLVREDSFCKSRPFFVSHTGGAVGASSVLLILPDADNKELCMKTAETDNDHIPKGVVVAIIVNMVSIGLNKEALDIAKLFEKASL